LNKLGIAINRKNLAEIAIHDADTFKLLVDKAKAALA
jgi:ribosomal protein L20